MKRFISILLVFVTLLALYACDEGVKDQTTTIVNTTDKSTEGVATTTTTITENSTENSAESTTGATIPTTTVNSLTTTVSTTKFSTVTQEDFHAPIQPSVFDDAIFVGDSVTNNLRLYLNRQKNVGKYPLGKAKLLCAASLNYTNSLWALDRPGNVHPSLDGKKVRVPDGVAMSGAKKVFIMLGMNDFITYGPDKTVQNAKKLINEILQKSPNVTIYVQSITPILQAKEEGNKTNANVRKTNQKLKAMCEQNGWIYLDVASVLLDDNGCLNKAYCIDPGAMGIHINDYACIKWIDYLRSNVFPPEPEPPTTTTTTTTKPTTTTTTTTTQTTTEITTTTATTTETTATTTAME